MDVCFREDQSRARAGYAAENLATLRRLALNLLKREKTKKRGIRGKQLNAGWTMLNCYDCHGFKCVRPDGRFTVIASRANSNVPCVINVLGT